LEQYLGGTLNGNPTAQNLPAPSTTMQLFYRGTDNSLYTRWASVDALKFTTTWSDEQKLGGILTGDPIAARYPG
jgi:hypothetical protein